MIRIAIAAALLSAFASVQEFVQTPHALAAKCVGADPCVACRNCEKCSYCKNGKTCGACKPKKPVLASGICR